MGENLSKFTREGGGSDVLKQLLPVCSLGRIGNEWGSNKNWKKSPLSVNFGRQNFLPC